MTFKLVTNKVEEIEEYCEFMGADEEDRAVSPEVDHTPCKKLCRHPDCRLALGWLAMLKKGEERFGKWRIHRNDSPELGQDMWQEVVDAGHKAMKGE